jgi:hypothetical protein
MFTLMLIPFAMDAIVGLALVYQESKKVESEYVQVSEGAEETKLIPESIQAHVDRYMKSEFDQQFCRQNWKKNAFNSKDLNTQMIAGLMNLGMVYASIMCAIESSMAPILSLFVTFYGLCSIYNYFEFEENTIVNVSASYFAVSKLTLLALAASADRLISTGSIDISFVVMSALLCFDAFYGLSVYLNQAQYTSEKKTFNSKSSFSATFFMDNWKTNLFRAQNISLKVAALFVLTLQITVAVSAVISATSILSMVVLGFTIVGLVSFFQTKSPEFTGSFTSYFASVMISALILLNFVFNGLTTENMMMAVVFIGDAIAGLALLKRSIRMEIFSVALDNSTLLSKSLKPTYAEDFKFVQSHFQQV